MLNPLVGSVTLGLYAVLLAVGGIIGFVKARSRPSLIAGLVSAASAAVAMGLALAGQHTLAWTLGLVLALVLFVFFGYRFAAKGRKFMPAGLLAVTSLVVLAVLILLLTVNAPAPVPAV